MVPCIEKNKGILFNGESALRSESFGTHPYAQNYQQPKERQTLHKRERERERERERD